MPQDSTASLTLATGGDVLLQSLATCGIRTIVGMPGTQNLAIYDALNRAGSTFDHYLIRNEQAATMIAAGYARASGRLAAALTVPGPGATNASTGLADALNDCVPVLLVTGGIERELMLRDPTKLFHGMDGGRFFQAIARMYRCPQNAAEIPEAVADLYRAMTGVRPGPAVLEVPPDVAAERTAVEPLRRPPTDGVSAPTPDPTSVMATARSVGEMRRPAILVGGDCIAADACPALRRLAERLAAPVLHSRLGKGAFSDSHPLNFGNSRHQRAREVLRAADGLIVIGTRLTQIDTRNWKLPWPARIVQIDRDVRELGREMPIAAGIAGDLNAALASLCDELAPRNSGEWGSALSEIRAGWRQPRVPILSDIRDALGSRDILACDVTSLSYRVFDQYPITEPRTVIYPCHFVTMGYGFPAALGAKLAQPDRHVVALCGDGGFLMSIPELATMAQYGIAVVVVVVADGALTAIRASQDAHYGGRAIDVAFPTPDFVQLAGSFGIHASRVDSVDQFPKLLAHALQTRRPALIEVAMHSHRAAIEAQIPWLHGE